MLADVSRSVSSPLQSGDPLGWTEYYLESLRMSAVSPSESGTIWTLKVAILF